MTMAFIFFTLILAGEWHQTESFPWAAIVEIIRQIAKHGLTKVIVTGTATGGSLAGLEVAMKTVQKDLPPETVTPVTWNIAVEILKQQHAREL